MKQEEDTNTVDPGFIAGFSAPLLGIAGSLIPVFLIDNLTNAFDFRKIIPFKLIQIEEEFEIINTTSYLVGACLANYVSSQLLNYLVYRSIITPKDFYKLSEHACNDEKIKHLPQDGVALENSSQINFFPKILKDNKRKFLIGLGFITTLGFFAWKGPKMPVRGLLQQYLGIKCG